MGRPAKTLLELIQTGAFRPKRHTPVLLAQWLPRKPPEWCGSAELWQALTTFQEEHYQACGVIERMEANNPPEILNELGSRAYWEYDLALRRRRRYLHEFSRAVQALRTASRTS